MKSHLTRGINVLHVHSTHRDVYCYYNTIAREECSLTQFYNFLHEYFVLRIKLYFDRLLIGSLLGTVESEKINTITKTLLIPLSEFRTLFIRI